MAFVVEDGTALSNATAYISVATFDSHHTDRNNESATDGTYDDIQKQGAIGGR